MLNKGVKATVIALALCVAGLVGCIALRHIIVGRASNEASLRLAAIGGHLEIDAGQSFWCIASARATFAPAGEIGAAGICLDNPISSLFGRKTMHLRAERAWITADIDHAETIESIAQTLKSARLQSAGGEANPGKRKLPSFDIVITQFGANMQKGDTLSASLRGRDIFAGFADGVLEFRGELTHALTGRRLPFSIDSMPQISVALRADRALCDASADIAFAPALEATFSFSGNQISGKLARAHISINDAGIALNAEDIAFSPAGGNVLPPVAGIGADRANPPDSAQSEARTPILGADAVAVSLPFGARSLSEIKEIRIDRPRLAIDLNKLPTIPALKDNAIFSAFVRFWNQEAGAFLGEAPKKSVRREDVKKNKPRPAKNPIPKETLGKWRDAIKSFEQRMQSLPAIDMRNGEIAVFRNGAKIVLDAISANTSEMFKENRDIEIHFDVRGADVMFGMGFSDNREEFPTFRIRASELGASDFLRVLNLPIPDRNSGSVTLSASIAANNECLEIGADLSLRDFAFYHPKISPETVEGINLSASMRTVYRFGDDTATLDPISLSSGPLRVRGAIKAESLRNNPVIGFKFSADPIPCEAIPEIIPKGLLPSIESLSFAGGALTPAVSGSIPWQYPVTSSFKATGFENKCIPLSAAPHRPETIAQKDFTHTTTYTYFVDSITVGPGTETYVPLSKIPPYVKAAMLLTEDKRFFEHGPLRVSFIERAIRLNLNARKYVYGGSTIGQQLVKNLFLRRTKNIARKIEEALITWHMETYVTKSRIFELYLNIIEFGPDVYGIEQAAQFYFGKHAQDLSPLEGAFLASLKVAPSKGGKFYKNGFSKDGRWWERRLKYIMKVLAENGYISPLEVIAAHDWTPQFYYPEDPNDWRRIWLERYAEYLRDGSKAAKRGAQGAEIGWQENPAAEEED